MKKLIPFYISLFLIITCSEQPTSSDNQQEPIDERSIYERLQSISNIEVNEITPKNGYDRQFEIYITQPLDHNNPDGITFKQRIFLSHTDESNPMIFMPSGYSSSPTKLCELSFLLNANQIYVAHRFMLGAEPDQLDWQYLNIEQASADFHVIVETFKSIYPEIWLSYGASKNGQAALFHKRYYPDDVEATVALVAPLSLGEEDARYNTFLATIGSESDRNKIKQFQRKVLENRDLIIPLINNYMNGSDFTFTRMSADKILEYEILEFPFSFWQVTDGNCSTIPDTSTNYNDLYEYLKNFGYFDVYSDEMLDFFQPVYYQAFTELGWYELIADHLQDLLVAVPNPSYKQMAPTNVPLNYNVQVIPDAIDWLQSNGDNIIYIYGENDPWTAGALESVGLTNSIKIIQPNANHSIKIEQLDQKALVYSTLEQWTGIPII